MDIFKLLHAAKKLKALYLRFKISKQPLPTLSVLEVFFFLFSFCELPSLRGRMEQHAAFIHSQRSACHLLAGCC